MKTPILMAFAAMAVALVACETIADPSAVAPDPEVDRQGPHWRP